MEIKVYGTEACPQCKAVKQYLTANGIAFEDVNLFEDTAMQSVLIDKGFMSIPVIEYDGKYIVGFNVKKLKEVLNNGND